MVNQVQTSLIKLIKTRAAVLLTLFVISTVSVFAVDLVTFTFDPQLIAMNQTVNVSFTFTKNGIQGFNFPRNTRDYDTVASSTSNNIQIINGQVSQNKTMSYVLRPLHEGTLNIPSISYTYQGQVYQTQPAQIQVTAAAAVQIQQALRSPSNQALQVNQAALEADPIVVNMATNYNPYVNQQFQIKTKIYHRGNLRGLNLSALQVDHVNIKRIDQAKEYTETKDGLEYMVYEVDYIVFPLKSGPITIPEYNVVAAVINERIRNPRARMDPFTFMTQMFEENELLIKAPAININVKPLPANAPAGFSGYVGSLAVNHQADKLTINSGDAITIKTNAYGGGNPKNLEFDFFEKSQLYSIYKDKENLNQEVNNGMEYFGLNASSAIIPERKSGRITIKTKPLISFNPFTKQFEEHGEEEFEIFVKPISNSTDTNGSAVEDELPFKDEIQAKREEFKKELSIYSVNEILSYKSWKNFDPSYLLIFLALLNFTYFTRFTMRRVKFKVDNNKVDYKDLTNRIKRATELEAISSIVKDVEKVLGDNQELKTKFQNFTSETDKYNYGFVKNFDETKLSELKNKAIELIKELKVNA
jgi:hypothetical protein